MPGSGDEYVIEFKKPANVAGFFLLLIQPLMKFLYEFQQLLLI